MKFTEIINQIKGIIENEFYFKKDSNGIYRQEIYLDYNDELSDSTIEKLLENENPIKALNELLSNWACDYTEEYGFLELIKSIKKNFSKKEIFEENAQEILEWMYENIYFYYPVNHFNKNVCVDIFVDTGDCNYDFTMNNILNCYSDGSGECNEFSSILWLAETQDKKEDLKNMTKKYIKTKNLLRVQ